MSHKRSGEKIDTMVEELIELKSAFRSLGDEDEEEKTEELPLGENLDEDKNPDGGSSGDDEEEEF